MPPPRTRRALLSDAEALLASMTSPLPIDASPVASLARSSSEVERLATAAARTEEQQWIADHAAQERKLAAVTAELSAVGGAMARATAHAAVQQSQPQRGQQPRRAPRAATREAWVSGRSVDVTPRPREPEWRRAAWRSKEQREDKEAAAAATHSVHRRRLTVAEQERRFEQLAAATTRNAQKRQEARAHEEARRHEMLKRQQVHFAKKANWSQLLDRLYVPPTPTAKRGLASLGSVAPMEAAAAVAVAQRQSSRPSGIPVRNGQRISAGAAVSASAPVATVVAPLPPALLEPADDGEEEAQDAAATAVRAHWQMLLDWDLATMVESLTAELEEREAELATRGDAVDDLMFKLRAVCVEGARNGLDLEAWLEDSWDQIEQERLLEREQNTPRPRGRMTTGVTLRRRQFIADAEEEQMKRSFMVEAGPALGLEAGDTRTPLHAPVILQAFAYSQEALHAGSPPAE